MASAKGICFALQKPLITLNTLTLMAHAAKGQLENKVLSFGYLVPMIDARRNEVFTAVYDADMKVCMNARPLILHEEAYADFSDKDIFFFGDGSVKWRPQCHLPRAFFIDIHVMAADMNTLTEQAFIHNDFAVLSSAIPFYGKEFYSTATRN
jgi:tRNA threonylcarbamoyladenosine biosynthesis protein TsaB